VSQDDQPTGRAPGGRQPSTPRTNNGGHRWTGSLRRWARSLMTRHTRTSEPSPERAVRSEIGQTNPSPQAPPETPRRSQSRDQPPTYAEAVSQADHSSQGRPTLNEEPPTYEEVVRVPVGSDYYRGMETDRSKEGNASDAMSQSSKNAQRSSTVAVEREPDRSGTTRAQDIGSEDEAARIVTMDGGRSYSPPEPNSAVASQRCSQERAPGNERRGGASTRPQLDQRSRENGRGR